MHPRDRCKRRLDLTAGETPGYPSVRKTTTRRTDSAFSRTGARAFLVEHDPLHSEATYRVVGVRADGSHTTISGRLPKDRANDGRDWLLRARAFPDVLVEMDDDVPGEDMRAMPERRRELQAMLENVDGVRELV